MSIEQFKLFLGKVPIIGMIHMYGETHQDRVERALSEIDTYERLGVDGAIVENYASVSSVEDDIIPLLEGLEGRTLNLALGVNVLPNEFDVTIPLADRYGLPFVQLDHVAGVYRGRGSINIPAYNQFRLSFPGVAILGGVHPKYYTPLTNLDNDLPTAVTRAEAVVVTGDGTGLETPIGRVKYFRQKIGNHPLIVGAGLNPNNAFESLIIADGAIVGSYFKTDNDPAMELSDVRIREILEIRDKVRMHKRVN